MNELDLLLLPADDALIEIYKNMHAETEDWAKVAKRALRLRKDIQERLWCNLLIDSHMRRYTKRGSNNHRLCRLVGWKITSGPGGVYISREVPDGNK